MLNGNGNLINLDNAKDYDNENLINLDNLDNTEYYDNENLINLNYAEDYDNGLCHLLGLFWPSQGLATKL